VKPDPTNAPDPTRAPEPGAPPQRRGRLRHKLFGKPRDILDPRTYHSISLIALLAWVGLGADGLSSSAYGPDEAFRALGHHHFIAVGLALATAFTVIVISLAYSKIIEHFPFGGGGYVVATRLLGPGFGVVSGSALLVDYFLTISVSIAAGAEAIFSFLPPELAAYKLVVEALAIVLLVVLNLRGVRESVSALAPIFAIFVLTHAILIFGAIGSHLFAVPEVAREVHHGFTTAVAQEGLGGVFGVFLLAYSMGAGTYTGIEAVSNGLQIMREPKVETAKRTMLYMSVSLAVTAGGILVAYLLFGVTPAQGKTMNAVLLERFASGFSVAGVPFGHGFVVVTLASEAALLFVAAQAGFLDGPRVMSNMATDSWLPHRFAAISERLVTQDGVLLMGGASLATLLLARGDITHLITMYSINVFVTFSLSQAAMIRYWVRHRRRVGRRRGLAIHTVAFALCAGILIGVVWEKGRQGGWVTIVVTSLIVALCFAVRSHYQGVRQRLRRLDEILKAVPSEGPAEPKPLDPHRPTAVMLVGSYAGLGIHALLTVQRLFPGHFKNFIFVSVGVIDAATMKGVEEVEELRDRTEASLQRYVELAHRLGLAAGYRMSVGTEAVTEAEKLCLEIAREFPRAVVFAGKLVFREERWFERVLHNETAYVLQRRLQFDGLNAMVLPVRVLDEPAVA
jgi:amino acid transporter